MSAVAEPSRRSGIQTAGGRRAPRLVAAARSLRLADWGVQLPILWLVSGTYFLASLPLSPARYLAHVVAVSLCQALLLAGGYLLNDVFDRHPDRMKPGRGAPSASGARRRGAAAVALLALGLAIAHAMNPPALAAIVWIQVVLGVAYSAPPVRLKERGVLGVLAAALLQRLPGFLMIAVAFPAPITLTAMLASWLALLGLITLLEHQLSDEPWDLAGGVRTWCVTGGRSTCLVARRICYAGFLLVTVAGAAWLATSGRSWREPAAAALLAAGGAAFVGLARRRYGDAPGGGPMPRPGPRPSR